MVVTEALRATGAVVETIVPCRFDRATWSRRRCLVIGLGVTWIFGGE
jgi:hypothetical protein